MSKEKRLFWKFSREHISLYVVLLVIPLIIIVAIAIYCAKTNSYLNLSVWVSLSMGLLTYIGSSILTIIVFYNSWIQHYQEEKLNYDIDARFNNGRELINFFSENKIPKEFIKFKYRLYYGEIPSPSVKQSYICLNLKNYNQKIPLYMKVDKIEIESQQQKTDCTHDTQIISSFNINEAIICNNEKIFLFIGIDEGKIAEISKDVETYFNTHINFYFHFYNNCNYNDYILVRMIAGNEMEIEKLKKRQYVKNLKSQTRMQECLLSGDFISDRIK